jgi:hypothetical protein
LVILWALSGCSATVRQSQLGLGETAGLGALSYGPDADRASRDDPSLFKSDTEILSDSAIRRILEFSLRLPASSRIAVLQLAERSLYTDYWSRISHAPATVPERLLAALRASPRVSHASFLPSLLVPKDRSVGHLREAAARYQADLLLVYSTDCRSYERYRFLASSQVKAVCQIEAILIDTRTGVVPFTSAVRQEFEARKTSQDANFNDTVRRAELAAIESGLSATGEKAVAFLSAAPTPTP